MPSSTGELTGRFCRLLPRWALAVLVRPYWRAPPASSLFAPRGGRPQPMRHIEPAFLHTFTYHACQSTYKCSFSVSDLRYLQEDKPGVHLYVRKMCQKSLSGTAGRIVTTRGTPSNRSSASFLVDDPAWPVVVTSCGRACTAFVRCDPPCQSVYCFRRPVSLIQSQSYFLPACINN